MEIKIIMNCVVREPVIFGTNSTNLRRYKHQIVQTPDRTNTRITNTRLTNVTLTNIILKNIGLTIAWLINAQLTNHGTNKNC